MEPFLNKLARELINAHRSTMHNVCVVLPSRRAGLFLKKHLGLLSGKAILSPKVFSIEDFIIKHSGYQKADPVSLLFELYSIQSLIAEDTGEDFDTFSSWANQVLNDFNEVDLYMADASQLFTYLNETKALVVWNLGEGPLTEFEENYIKFYRSLLEYYNGLRDKLEEKKLAYQGMAYRHMAEHIREIASELPYEKIYFAGLNALTTSEEVIIDHLVSKEKASLYWDADEYYISDEKQEAGRFLRNYLPKWGPDNKRWVDHSFRDIKKKITVTGVPRNIGQAKLAGHIAGEWKDTLNDGEKTAIVLADEKLLMPVLHSIPTEVSDINVTMGYPIRHSPLYQLIRTWFQMQLNREKLQGKQDRITSGFYYKDVIKVLGHPYLSIWEETGIPSLMYILLNQLKNENRIFIGADDLASLMPEGHQDQEEVVRLALKPWEEDKEIIPSLIRLLDLLKNRMIALQADQEEDFSMELEYIYHFRLICNRIKDQMVRYPRVRGFRSLQKLLFMVIDSFRIPFYGEPLKGLQIMGLLETRTLDFENLIILSASEDILPAARHYQSFIPFDVKKEFSLPTHHEKDAVFAYHFYRMIQRASNIHLMYNTESDSLGGGERSRFITQLAYELPKYNPDVAVESRILSIPIPASAGGRHIRITKTPAVVGRVLDRMREGLSPTGLSLYISCPLRFYFQEIEKISESEEVEETIEARTLGTVMHFALEKLYQPYLGQYITPSMLGEEQKKTGTLIRQAFERNYKGDIEHGKNHLIYRVAIFLLSRFIRMEKELLEKQPRPGSSLKVLLTEYKLAHELATNIQGQITPVRLKGKADRIDNWMGDTRIVDYKTGTVRKKELEFEDWGLLFSEPEHTKAFQLITYAYLFWKEHPDSFEQLSSGNISLNSLSSGFLEVKLQGNGKLDRENLTAFENGLVGLLNNVANPEIPFEQTENLEQCTYCPFKMICNR